MIDFTRLCGAKPSPIDNRDYQFKDLIGCVTKILPYQNTSKEPMRDQGSSSMCGAFAGASYRYSQEWYQSSNKDLFSTTMIYGADLNYSGEGMYGRDLAKILVSGICKKKNWESIGSKSQCRNLYKIHKDEVKDECNTYRSSSYYYCNSWTEILTAIRITNGCIIMVPVYDNWYNCPDTGIVGKNKGTFYGYHFITALDYTQNSDGSYRIRFKNSWGDQWGNKGYGYLDTNVNGFTEAFAIIDNVDEVKNMLYKDVDESKWYSEAIEKVTKAGLMQGDGDEIFRPEDPVTRAELAQVICNLKNL